MNKREQKGHEREGREHERHEREGHDREGRGHDRDEHRHRDREESGDDPRRHATIIERRWLGSAPPTEEQYARALHQWHALPGTVMWPATDVKLGLEAPAAATGVAGEEVKP